MYTCLGVPAVLIELQYCIKRGGKGGENSTASEIQRSGWVCMDLYREKIRFSYSGDRSSGDQRSVERARWSHCSCSSGR